MRTICRWIRVGLLCAGTVALAGSISKEEFDCEEAVQHLADCCPDFDPHSVTCGGGCDKVEVAEEQSACLKRATCQSLRDSGACKDPMGGYQCQ
jgi:hypothetical protein